MGLKHSKACTDQRAPLHEGFREMDVVHAVARTNYVPRASLMYRWYVTASPQVLLAGDIGLEVGCICCHIALQHRQHFLRNKIIVKEYISAIIHDKG
jgi:hypothetical protein